VAAALWDNKNREIDGASPRGCIFSKCIPREVQAQQAETNQNAQQRIPILYVPLTIFGCLSPVFASGRCCNLLHFVHKVLRPLTLTQN
jgi:hypothetical protein